VSATLSREEAAERDHHADEFTLNELTGLTELLTAKLQQWPTLHPGERADLLDERADLVQHLDVLADRAPESISPSLREGFRAARERWNDLRSRLLALGA
jgi:hypothetical protein